MMVMYNALSKLKCSMIIKPKVPVRTIIAIIVNQNINSGNGFFKQSLLN